jgi:hypothetical protein
VNLPWQFNWIRLHRIKFTGSKHRRSNCRPHYADVLGQERPPLCDQPGCTSSPSLPTPITKLPAHLFPSSNRSIWPFTQFSKPSVGSSKDRVLRARRFAWVLGSRYAFSSSNKTLGRVIEEYTNEKFKGKNATKRPDLLLLNRVDGKHLLIEFKRPKKELDRGLPRTA